ncbi:MULTISPECIES: nitrous oxide reductase accessory protein NosL [unclassified Sphingobacterium]|uniref:nitrous oxide reductase accessory protein NosL n=1 Tax=unclassified Sphingobacterium TaxID=2609468 RepID=UPI0025F9CFF1|nr:MULTISPECIES: nitrous oxide reductase accessory protein NosL [unclassified Sphingobacterium]
MRNYKLFALICSSILLVLFSLQACQGNNKPKPIKYGSEQCAHCKMTITDVRFGTQLQTKKGRVFNFDDVQCMIAFVNGNSVKKEEIAVYYLSDYVSHNLIPAADAYYLKSESLKSPMRGNIAVFEKRGELDKVKAEIGGTVMTWNDLWK